MAATSQLNKFRQSLSQQLHQKNALTDILDKIEQKTGQDRVNIVAGLFGLLSIYLIFGHFAELVCNLIGFVYPAIASIRAVESANKEDDTQWLTYWVVFALFSIVEFGVEHIFAWFPIYWVCKVALLLYLALPMTRGAQKVYNCCVRPLFQRHESTIDRFFGQASNKAKEVAKDVLGEDKSF